MKHGGGDVTDTLYSADAVEFCPAALHVLVCGTYQLLKDEEGASERKRVGRLLVLTVDDDSLQLGERSRLEVPAVLDAKWNATGALLGVASAAAQLNLFRLSDDSAQLHEVHCAALPANDSAKEPLCLSLDWCDRLSNNAANNTLVASDSLGRLHTWALAADGLRPDRCWHAHDFEAWIAASDWHTPDMVYSGGDDMLLHAWDLRQPDGSGAAQTKRTHTAGVCSIQKHPHRPHLLATGGYDDRLNLWDVRSWKRPLATHNAAGGVWRIKWHSHKPDVCALACMYGGAEIVRLDASEAAFELVQSYTGHTSICYGIDWHPTQPDVVASCSFYDHSLHTWRTTA